jgi:hypothetical protein
MKNNDNQIQGQAAGVVKQILRQRAQFLTVLVLGGA